MPKKSNLTLEEKKEKQKNHIKTWIENDNNREKKNKKDREYKKANKERENERSREYYKNNREKILKQKKIYQEANKDKINSKQNERRQKEREEALAEKNGSNIEQRPAKRQKMDADSSINSFVSSSSALGNEQIVNPIVNSTSVYRNAYASEQCLFGNVQSAQANSVHSPVEQNGAVMQQTALLQMQAAIIQAQAAQLHAQAAQLKKLGYTGVIGQAELMQAQMSLWQALTMLQQTMQVQQGQNTILEQNTSSPDLIQNTPSPELVQSTSLCDGFLMEELESISCNEKINVSAEENLFSEFSGSSPSFSEYSGSLFSEFSESIFPDMDILEQENGFEPKL